MFTQLDLIHVRVHESRIRSGWMENGIRKGFPLLENFSTWPTEIISHWHCDSDSDLAFNCWLQIKKIFQNVYIILLNRFVKQNQMCETRRLVICIIMACSCTAKTFLTSFTHQTMLCSKQCFVCALHKFSADFTEGKFEERTHTTTKL